MTPKITPDLSMEELLERYPGARRALFSAFHIGGCQSCAYRPDESLSEVCQNHQIALQDALDCLSRSQEHDQRMLIATSDLKSMMDQGGDFLILDTRTREEFEAITLPGALFMTQDLQASLFADPKNKQRTIVLFDHRGQSILDHCAWFRGHGLEESFGLDGGIDRFSREIDSSIPRYRLEID